jgi:hypothetical protein
MSQLGVYGATAKHHSGVLVNDFATLTLTAGVAGSFKVGELITGGTSGVTAKVSGIANPGTNTILRIKAIKVKSNTDTLAYFTDGETITGATSLATATAATPCFAFHNKSTRNVAGTPTSVTYDDVYMNDKGVNINHAVSGTVLRPAKMKEVKYAMRLAASKSQITDTTVVPVTLWEMPAAGTYSAAGATLMRFVLTSNEALSVVGSPRVAIADFGPVALTTTSIAFAATGKTLTRVGGSWITDNVVAGSRVAILGTASNNVTYTVFSVPSPTVIVVVETPVDEAANVAAAATLQGNTVYATYNTKKSKSMRLIFDYVTAEPIVFGQIASATYDANGAVVADIGGAVTTITPAAMGSVTGILIAA